MARAYFLGVGGSGSKSVEAFVHLCIAGLGPREVTIGLIDQDAGNGHVSAVRQLIEEYARVREDLRPAAQDGLGADTGLLRTQLRSLRSGLLWQPEDSQSATLAGRILHKNLLPAAQQLLMDCLFAPEEQLLPLDKGFCGRPNLGAVVFANAERRSAFWNELTESIQSALQAGEDVQVFLAGSSCGGTGAAGFPTLSRLLHEDLRQGARAAGPRRADSNSASHLSGTTAGHPTARLGGALLLPYFTFPSRKAGDEAHAEAQGVTEVAADSATFLEETAQALRYYHHLLRETPVLDALYLVGFDPLHLLEHRSLGGPDQHNPPLLPELYAALAAARFMGPSSASRPLQYIGRAPGRVLGWEDLPGVRDATGKEHTARERLGQLLRFAHAFHAIYEPHLRPLEWKGIRRQAWFHQLVGSRGVDLEQAGNHETLARLRGLCRKVLGYFADLSFAGSSSNLEIELVKATQFALPVRGAPNRWSQLLDPEKVAAGEFGSLICDPRGQRASCARQIMEGLACARVGPQRAGLGIFCGALFDQCAL